MSNKLKPKGQAKEMKINPAIEAGKEIDSILEKYNCRMTVVFRQEMIMNQEVLVYIPSIIPNEKQ